MRSSILCLFISFYSALNAQAVMTPELLWSLGRVGGETISPDGNHVIYGVTYYDVETGTSERNLYSVGLNKSTPLQLTTTQGSENSVMKLPNDKMGFILKGQIWQSEWDGSQAIQLTNYDGGLNNVRFSPDGNYIMFSKDVHMENINANEIYKDVPGSTAKVINSLNYRHWDTWEDGAYSHLFYAKWDNGKITSETDIMAGEKFDSPQMPFGGIEDMVWHPDGKFIVYVKKEKSGTEYTTSTNTDIFVFNIENGKTQNFTVGMMGYDTNPNISPDGTRMAWLSMERDGYEADKNRIYILEKKTNTKIDASESFDESIDAMRWSNNGKFIYFTAPVDGTIQLFELDVDNVFTKVDAGKKRNPIRRITTGDFDITGIIGETNGMLVVSRTDMNHATEIFIVNPATGKIDAVTSINNPRYDKIKMGKTERKMVQTTDGKEMLVWFIYPPDFDPAKKYPTLLYCQGGPQSALTQFYSFRWNFQLMAANGYIIVAPNRRGMPGHGTEWNEAISKDWGGQAIKDYY
ncbi:MAG: S9 family peptidase, partial [Chitinophagales bacterium]